MPWTAFSATIDPDKADVGAVSATYTDPADPDLVFTYSARIAANVAGLQQFKADANAALGERLTRRAVELAGITWMTNNLNS